MSGNALMVGPRAQSGLAVIYSQHGHTVEFSLHGELALGNAAQLERAVAATIRGRLEGIVIDIGALAFVDLVGVRALVAISDCCAANQTALSFRGTASPQVVRMLSLLGCDQRLGIAC